MAEDPEELVRRLFEEGCDPAPSPRWDTRPPATGWRRPVRWVGDIRREITAEIPWYKAIVLIPVTVLSLVVTFSVWLAAFWPVLVAMATAVSLYAVWRVVRFVCFEGTLLRLLTMRDRWHEGRLGHRSPREVGRRPIEQPNEPTPKTREEVLMQTSQGEVTPIPRKTAPRFALPDD